MSTGEPGLAIEDQGEGVIVLRLADPDRLNPISVEVREAWNDFFVEVEQGKNDCRAVVLTGTGRAFSAGGDVSQMTDFFGQGPDVATSQMNRFQEMSRLAWRSPVPVIAAMNGSARGGGTAVSLLADLRIASTESTFSVGQVRRGLVPDIGATYLLPRVVGLARAMEMMLFDRQIDAATASEIGLVNLVVEPDQVLPTAIEWGREIARLPEPAVRWIKKVTHMNLDSGYDEALNLEAISEGVLTGTPEFGESLARFLEGKN